MSVPVSRSTAQEPHVVSTPQQHRILSDIQECIKQLREEFSDHHVPVNDDNKTLHRFCAKLEYLLQAHMKDKYSILGRKKDYWDFIMESLSSTKGLTDGIKYVKSIGEHKTSLGKGRAFIRFSLVHQRLPDSIQQCAMNPRTSEWYHPQSIWFQTDKIADLIGSLYDLNDVHFDLSPKGYDLDTAWPSFARNQTGNFVWNMPSRRSSISSLASLQMDSSSVINLSSTPDNSAEFDRLTQHLESAESARLDLQIKVDSLEQQNMEVNQSVWSAQGGLQAVTDQLRDVQRRHDEILDKYQDLTKRHDKLLLEQTEWKRRESDLLEQCQQSTQQQQNLDLALGDLKSDLESSRIQMAALVQEHQNETIALDDAFWKMELKLKASGQELALTKESEKNGMQKIENLQEKVNEFERRNEELLKTLEQAVDSKDRESSAQLETVERVQELVDRLKQVESDNLQMSTSVAEFENQFRACEAELKDVRLKNVQLESSLMLEKETNKTNILLISQEVEESTVTYEAEMQKLKKEILRLEALHRDTTESVMSRDKETTLMKELLEERNSILFESFSALCSLCNKDACDVDRNNIANLTKTDLSEMLKSYVCTLSEERNSLQSKFKEEEKLKTSFESDFYRLEKENSEVCEKFYRMERAHEQLKIIHKELGKNYEQIKTDHEQLIIYHEQFERAHEQLKLTHEQLNITHENLEKDYGVMKTDFEQLEKDHQQFKRDHQQLKSDSKETEIELRNSLSHQNDEIESYRDSLNVTRSQLAETTALLESKCHSLDEINSDLEMKTELLESQNKCLDEVVLELRVQTELVQSRSQSLDTISSELEKKCEEVKHLNVKLEKSRCAVFQLLTEFSGSNEETLQCKLVEEQMFEIYGHSFEMEYLTVCKSAQRLKMADKRDKKRLENELRTSLETRSDTKVLCRESRDVARSDLADKTTQSDTTTSCREFPDVPRSKLADKTTQSDTTTSYREFPDVPRSKLADKTTQSDTTTSYREFLDEARSKMVDKPTQYDAKESFGDSPDLTPSQLMNRMAESDAKEANRVALNLTMFQLADKINENRGIFGDSPSVAISQLDSKMAQNEIIVESFSLPMDVARLQPPDRKTRSDAKESVNECLDLTMFRLADEMTQSDAAESNRKPVVVARTHLVDQKTTQSKVIDDTNRLSLGLARSQLSKNMTQSDAVESSKSMDVAVLHLVDKITQSEGIDDTNRLSLSLARTQLSDKMTQSDAVESSKSMDVAVLHLVDKITQSEVIDDTNRLSLGLTRSQLSENVTQSDAVESSKSMDVAVLHLVDKITQSEGIDDTNRLSLGLARSQLSNKMTQSDAVESSKSMDVAVLHLVDKITQCEVVEESDRLSLGLSRLQLSDKMTQSDAIELNKPVEIAVIHLINKKTQSEIINESNTSRSIVRLSRSQLSDKTTQSDATELNKPVEVAVLHLVNAITQSEIIEESDKLSIGLVRSQLADKMTQSDTTKSNREALDIARSTLLDKTTQSEIGECVDRFSLDLVGLQLEDKTTQIDTTESDRLSLDVTRSELADKTTQSDATELKKPVEVAVLNLVDEITQSETIDESNRLSLGLVRSQLADKMTQSDATESNREDLDIERLTLLDKTTQSEIREYTDRFSLDLVGLQLEDKTTQSEITEYTDRLVGLQLEDKTTQSEIRECVDRFSLDLVGLQLEDKTTQSEITEYTDRLVGLQLEDKTTQSKIREYTDRLVGLQLEDKTTQSEITEYTDRLVGLQLEDKTTQSKIREYTDQLVGLQLEDKTTQSEIREYTDRLVELQLEDKTTQVDKTESDEISLNVTKSQLAKTSVFLDSRSQCFDEMKSEIEMKTEQSRSHLCEMNSELDTRTGLRKFRSQCQDEMKSELDTKMGWLQFRSQCRDEMKSELDTKMGWLQSRSQCRDEMKSELDTKMGWLQSRSQCRDEMKSELDTKTGRPQSRSRKIKSELEVKSEAVNELNSTLQKSWHDVFELLKQLTGDNDKVEDFDSDEAVSAARLHIQMQGTKISDINAERDTLSTQLRHLQSSDTDRGKELCCLQENLKDLQDSLASSRTVETDLRKELLEREMELRQKVEAMSNTQEKVGKLVLEISCLNEAKTGIEEENTSLRSELISLQQEVCQLNITMATANEKLQHASMVGDSAEQRKQDLETILQEKDVELQEKRSLINLLEGRLESLNCEVNDMRFGKETSHSQTCVLENELDDARSQKHLLEEQVRDLSKLLSNEVKEREETDEKLKGLSEQNGILEVRIKEISHLLSQEKKGREHTDQQMSLVSEEVISLTGELGKLGEDFDIKEKGFSETIDRHETERADLTRQLEEALTDTGRIEKLYEEFDATEKSYKDTIHQHESERKELTKQLEEALTDTGIIKQQLTDKLKELEEVCSLKSQILRENEDLTSSLRILDSSYREIKDKLSVYEESNVGRVSPKQGLEEEKSVIMSLNQEIENLKLSKSHCLEEKDSKLRALHDDIRQLEESNKDLKQECVELQKENIATEERVTSAVNELSDLKEVLMEKEKMLSDYLTLLGNLKQCVTALETSLAEKSRKCEEVENYLSDQCRKCEELESVSSREKSSLQEQVESLSQEVSALQFQLSVEQLQHEEVLKSSSSEVVSLSELHARIAEQEVLIGQLEQEVSSQSTSRTEETDAQTHQLADMHSLLQIKEEENQLLGQRLQNTEASLDQEKLAHQQLKELKRKQLLEKDEEIMILISDRKQLTRKLIRLVKDKDVLWQKTDQLTYEQKVQANEKWMDGGKVTHCLTCNAEFSLWLRKHHCRLCGRIYCYSCSDYWVQTAHSSKKERACEGCYTRLQMLETDSNTSVLLQDSDDEFTASMTNVSSSSSSKSVAIKPDSAQDVTKTDLKRSVDESEEVYVKEPENARMQPGFESESAESKLKSSGDESAEAERKRLANVGTEAHSKSLSVETEDAELNRSGDDRKQDVDKNDNTSAERSPIVFTIGTPNDTDDRKTEKKLGESPPQRAEPDDVFQVITDEEVTRSLTEYDVTLLDQAMGPNMQSSLVLSAEELAKGEINSQNKVWVKPGKSFAVPVSIQTPNTVLSWEFSSHPKDIVFSVGYRETATTSLDASTEVLPPCKCDSHKQVVHGEVTAKQPGVYTLLFDNTYSKMTSKEVNYTLKLTTSK